MIFSRFAARRTETSFGDAVRGSVRTYFIGLFSETMLSCLSKSFVTYKIRTNHPGRLSLLPSSVGR